MKSISQTRFLAENYSTLHGLKIVPLGACLLVISLWANRLHGPARDLSFPIIVLLGSLLLSLAAAGYYQRSFGMLKQTPAAQRLEHIEEFMLGTLALLAFWADVSLKLPISLTGLVLAVTLLAGRPRVSLPLNQYSVIKLGLCICLALLSLAPLYSGMQWWQLLGVKSALLGVCMLAGAFIVVEGLLWHIFFILSLPAVERKDE